MSRQPKKEIMSDSTQENHRTRVAAERRKRTRMRLLESALVLCAQQGPEAPMIDDVIQHAGVSRGSFYNYFKTYEELLEAVAVQVGEDLVRIVDPAVCRTKIRSFGWRWRCACYST